MRSIDEYVLLLLDEPYKKSMEMLDSFDNRLTKFQNERPTQLIGFKEHLNKVEKTKVGLTSLKCELSLDVILSVIMDDISKAQDKWLSDKQNAFAEIDAELDNLKNEIEISNKSHNRILQEQNAAVNVTFESLEAKRKILEGYSDKIFDMCNQYGISTSDINVDETNFTAEELDRLYDDYIKYMQKESKGTNIISRYRTLVKDSLYVHGFVIFLFAIVCFTPILDFVSIAFFIALAMNQISNMNRVKYYSVLLAIVFNTKPENMGYVQLDESQLLPEELTPEMMDNDERFSDYEKLYDAVEADFEDVNPQHEQITIMNEWSSRQAEFAEKLDTYKKLYTNKVHAILHDINLEIEYLEGEYERLRKEYKFIGERFKPASPLDYDYGTTYTFGLHDDCMEETIDMGFKNVIVRPNLDKELMNKFLQTVFANAITNVRPGLLKIMVYDPNDFGRSLMPFYSSDLKDVFEIYNDGLDALLDDLTNYVQENFKFMQGSTILEYNKKAQETGKTPIEYRLLLILSQPDSVETDEKLRNFFEYSNNGGVIIWMVSATMESDNAYVFKRPFDNIPNPVTFRINDEWCNKVSQKYIDAVNASKPPALLWDDFITNIFTNKSDNTRKDLWYGKADKYIEFYPGYEDGDPNLYKPYTLGNDGNVHAIGVGTSGAGKSVFLNHLIGTMCRVYDPKELELWLCDFKGVEFKAYMKTPRAKAARLCKPVKAEEGYVTKTEEKKMEVLGYYKYDSGSKEYLYSKEPTEDCNELHVFFQDLDKKGNVKQKNGVPVKPYPKTDTDYEDNMESYCLPHIAACLCTSDGDFATSLFKAYRDKADTRYEDMKILGVKNMPGWNARVKSLLGTKKPQGLIEAHGKETGFNPIWTEDDIWPRVLFVCDEFQVIFQKADAKNVEKIKADITQIAKVARACGMHIFFTSQSMKGTVSSDILANFTLRFALRCEPEVSQDIIGSKRAAEIREKNGYLIVKSLEMKTAEDQKKYKTPFLNDDEGSGKETTSQLFDNIRMLYNLAKERGFKEKQVISYEESTKHPIKELIDTYNDPILKTKLPESGVFFLGNRMAYSQNKAPDNIILSAKNNENILSCFTDYNDIVMFFKSLVQNIKCNRVPGTVIINSQIDELAYITEAESEVTYPDLHGHLLPSTGNTCKEVLNWIQKLYESRKAANKKDSPVWIFLFGWDKGTGIGVDVDVTLRTKLNNILQLCGEYHIHIIFINTGMTGFAASTVNACKYNIAGKCSLDDSTSLIGTKQASLNYDMRTGWFFSKHDSEITRDKIYISPVTREITSTEIVI